MRARSVTYLLAAGWAITLLYRITASPDGAAGWISFILLWLFTISTIVLIVRGKVESRRAARDDPST
jgi:hypothetical protein